VRPLARGRGAEWANAARAKAEERLSIEALTNLLVTTPTGATVPLRELATFQSLLLPQLVWVIPHSSAMGYKLGI
jgi:multidrug efflux pump subunit AcrB